MSARLLKWAAVCAALSLLSACMTYGERQLDMHRSLAAGQPGMALQALEAQKSLVKRDRALYELNRGMLLRLTGDYVASNESLESAKQLMQNLSATSISENLTALTVNEATRSYAGQPHEQLLLHAYKALNYLESGNIDSARVEMLQADVKMREWADSDAMEGIKASAFVRYLAGVVFEMNGEWSDALIAYRKAYEAYKTAERPVPGFLQQDLLRLTQHQGLKDEHRQLSKVFDRNLDYSTQELRKHAELIVIYHQGLVSEMREHLVYSFSTELSYSVQIATPFYDLPPLGHPSLRVSVDEYVVDTEFVESIDQLARDNLDARMPGIVLRTVARAVVKNRLSHEARQENLLAGFVIDIVGLVTERADTRSWSSLPSSIQMTRLVLPPGEHLLRIQRGGLHIEGEGELRDIVLRAGEKRVVSIHLPGNY